jgi:hypothetical protein
MSLASPEAVALIPKAVLRDLMQPLSASVKVV